MRPSNFIFKFIGCCLLSAVVGVASFVPAQTKGETAERGESPRSKNRREIFEQVWQSINDKYYDVKFNGNDWAATRLKFLPLIEKANTDAEFYALLDQMAGELNDSHTRVYSPAQLAERRTNRKNSDAGIIVARIENLPVVVSVTPDSDAERQGVKPGMIVHAINGQSITEAIADAKKTTGASSSARASQMRVFSKILAGENDSILRLDLLDSRSGKRRHLGLRRASIESSPLVEARLLFSGIAYLKFTEFAEEIEKEIETQLDRFADAPALILDLRDNHGGEGEVGLRFAAHFFKNEITVARLITRDNLPPAPDVPMILKTGGTVARTYDEPVVILINEGTASTSELIANAFQEEERAQIFGVRSCGCVLGILAPRLLTGGGELTLSEFGFVTAKDKNLEGKGIMPDKIVLPKIKELREKRDEALRQAEKYLVERLEK